MSSNTNNNNNNNNNVVNPIVGENCIVTTNDITKKLRITTGENRGGYYECTDDTNDTISSQRNSSVKLIIRSTEKTKQIITYRKNKINNRRNSSSSDTLRNLFIPLLQNGFVEEVAGGQYREVQVNEEGNIVGRGETVGEQTTPPTQNNQGNNAGGGGDAEEEDDGAEEEDECKKRKLELNGKEQELNEREDECKKRKLELDEREGALGRIMKRSQDDCSKCKLELDNREKELDKRDEENKKRKLELDTREKELDERKKESDGDSQLANKQKLLDGIMKHAEETNHPMAVLAVKELEELLSTNNTTQTDQDVDQKIANVLQRFQSCMNSIVEREFTYSTKEYCEVISILMASHSKDVTTKKVELASNKSHTLKSEIEKEVNAAKVRIGQNVLVKSSSATVEEGEASLKEINTQLKTLYSNANEELKKKYNDKLSDIMKTETEDEITLEEDKNTKAKWNNYIEKDHFANY